jgi:uncharacterized protein involved in outer membrane biogenesis
MRWVKLLGFVIGGLVALLIAAGAALWFGGGPLVVWIIEHPGSTMMGREIRIAGPLTIRWGAPTQVVAEDVQIANTSWGSQPQLFSARRIEVDIFARTLLRGPPRIPLIALDGANLLLETSDQGEGNWKFGASSAAPKKRHEFPDLAWHRRLGVRRARSRQSG